MFRRKVPLHQPAVLLLGSYGRGNSGDDVFLHAALNLLSGMKLYVNSADDALLPADVRAQVTTISTVSARDAFKKVMMLMSVQSIVYWGGDVWVELYDDRFPRKSLYKMIIVNLLARLLGKRAYYVGCGIGALHGWSLWLARCSARLAQGIVLRERRSAMVLGLPRVRVLPDLACALPYYEQRSAKTPGKSLTVGVSLLYYVPNPKTNFPKIVQQLADELSQLPQNRYTFVLLPMLTDERDLHNDLWASQQLQTAFAARGITCRIQPLPDVASVIAAARQLDVVIGARLHANILATFAGTPCIGLAYRPKVASFFADNGLSEYCLDLADLDQLPELLQEINGNYQAIARQFAEVSQENLEQKLAYERFVAIMTETREEMAYQDPSPECE